MQLQVFAICAFFFVTSSSKELPKNFNRCIRSDPNFNKCLTKAIETALQVLSQPVKELGLNSLEPIHVPIMNIGAGSGAVQFQQHYTNLNIYGLTKATSLKAKIDFSTNTLNLKATIPEVKMAFNYEFDGKILVLPVSGKGPGIIILRDSAFDLTFSLETYNKNGKKYYRIKNNSLKIDPQLITFDFKNLFEGEDSLAAPTLKVFNDNWKEVWADVRDQYEEAHGAIFSSIFAEVLKRVTVSELFGEE